jgi:cytochrome oxidase Cu insertion factor (SCO1/SenC/PrrC family)
MDSPSRKVNILVWGALVLTAGCILVAFVLQRLQLRSAVPLQPISQVSPFTLTNQLGQPVTLSNLLGHVWVADIIFTRCAGPCPQMTRAMRELQDSVSPRDPVKFVTLTTDPDYDTPAILKPYAQQAGANPSRWLFLTGSKDQIAHLALDGLKLAAQEKPAADRETPVDLFIHSTLFVVVDKQGRVQAIFDRQAPGFKSSLLSAVRILQKR